MKDLIDKLKSSIKRLLLLILAVPKKIIGSILLGLKDILLHPVIVGVFFALLGFMIGARLFEVGFFANMFGRGYKGATVFLSGACKENGQLKVPALARDQVLITSEDLKDHKMGGVILKTRELIDCDTNDVAIDKLPLLANLKAAPINPPDLASFQKDPIKEPEWKKLLQKTVIMSGSCLGGDGRSLPPFTDEKVDVTNVVGDKTDPALFTIFGLKKSDKVAVTCANTSVKYALYDDKPAAPLTMPTDATPKIKSFLNKTILVTSTCFPDPRTPKSAQKRKVAFYRLINSKVQVLEEALDNDGKLKKFTGAALEFGDMVYCDRDKFPLTYSEYDEDMKQTPIKSNLKLGDDGAGVAGSTIQEAPAVGAESNTGAADTTKAVNDNTGGTQ